MKTIKEKIEVMQAFADGKTIQIAHKDDDYAIWTDCTAEPIWNWNHCDFRVKPEPTYRPYESVAELVEDYKARFHVDNPSYTMPTIWYREKNIGIIFLYDVFDDNEDFLQELVRYEYLDGTPFGKLVEE